MSIELDFRPDTYADFDDPVAFAVNGISGQMRRAMVRDMLTAEGAQRERYDALLGPIQPDILEERAEESFIRNLSGLWGPSWMGGEYLPLMKPGEVEIARVVLASTTMDVFSLRARRLGGRYRYRLVDEYRSHFWLCRKTSRRTLTLAQVIEMLETVECEDNMDLGGMGIVRAWWDQQWENDRDPERCTGFAWVESEVYPGLSEWYRERAMEWRRDREAGPDPWTPMLEVYLPLPEGWRWVDEDEWREELALMDVDLETRVGASLDSFSPPMCAVAKEPRGFRGASTTVMVEQLQWHGDDAPASSDEALSRTLMFCTRVYDDFTLVTFPEEASFGGHPGSRMRVLFSQPRKDGAPLPFDCVFHSVAVGDRLVHVCAATAQGASRATWEELDRVLAGIRFRWVRIRGDGGGLGPAAPALGPGPEEEVA